MNQQLATAESALRRELAQTPQSYEDNYGMAVVAREACPLILEELDRLRKRDKQGPWLYYLPTVGKPGEPGYDSFSYWMIDGFSGTLSISGDWGEWSHCWGPHGRCDKGKEDFRHEILRFGCDYIARKLSYNAPKHVDYEEVQRKVREAIIRDRRDRAGMFAREAHPKVLARQIWDAVEDVEDECGFLHFLDDWDGWDRGWSDFARRTVINQAWLTKLTEVSFPRLKEMLRKDLGED